MAFLKANILSKLASESLSVIKGYIIYGKSLAYNLQILRNGRTNIEMNKLLAHSIQTHVRSSVSLILIIHRPVAKATTKYLMSSKTVVIIFLNEHN